MYPKISVIIPSFNHDKYLEQCINSILSQNYKNNEIIIMDGGSTDSTLSIINKYENYLTYWKSAPDLGQSDAINQGFTHTTGDLISWLNSDDWYINNSLWLVANVFKKYPQHGLIIGNGFREKDNSLKPFCPRHIAISQKILCQGMDYILQPSTFISRKAWEKSGGVRNDLHFGFDWEFFNRVLINFSAVSINEFLSVSREHLTTKTSTGKMNRAEELIKIAKLMTGQEITLGSMYYLFETLLQLNETEIPMSLRHNIYQGMVRIQAEMKNRWDTCDSFPVISDRKNINYIQIPNKEKINFKETRSKKHLPKISITIPSFNQAEYLSKAISSILNQNYPNLELFIYDGGSTDDSVQIIEKYKEYITDWCSAPDNGPATAINKGLINSSGEIIGWLNSDDMLADGAIWAIAEAFMTDPETQVVFGNAVYIDERDDLYIADHGNNKTGLYYGKLQPIDKVPYYWQYVHSIPQPTVYFRKELRNKVGLINTKYKNIFDFEYFWRMRGISEFKKIEKTLAFYRIHSKSKTSNWENFLIELYDFSRPLWPAANIRDFSAIQADYINVLLEREFNGYRRRLFPIKQLLKVMTKFNFGNPEIIIKQLKRGKVTQTIPGNPIGLRNDDNRPEVNYIIDTSHRKYKFAFCGFFFPRHPGNSGGEIRDFHLLRKLLEIGEIEFFALSTVDKTNHEDCLGQYFKTINDPQVLRSFFPALVDNAALKLRHHTKILGWLRKRKIPVLGPRYHEDVSQVAYLNDAYVKRGLHQVLSVNQPDFLIITPQLNPLPIQLYKTNYNTRIILSSYDVERIRIERLAASNKQKLSQYAMLLETQRASKFEEETLKIYDGIIAVSNLDKQKYVELYGYDAERILVLDNSVDTDYFSFSDRIITPVPEVVFTASMGYYPNDEAAKRLITKIMPIVRKTYPSAKLWIVGQYPSKELVDLCDNELNIVTGAVPDIRPYMDRATVACIPLQTGSGTKYKVLEAASLGVPIVCTKLSIEGINLNGEDHVILGETDLELAKGVINVINNPKLWTNNLHKAAEVIKKEYSWNSNLIKIEPWLEIIKALPIR